MEPIKCPECMSSSIHRMDCGNKKFKLIRDIKVNKVKCLKCNEIIESTHRHHFTSCKCGNISVDGGKDYLRRVGNITGGTWEELSEYANT